MSSQTKNSLSQISSLCALIAVLTIRTAMANPDTGYVEPNAEAAASWWPPMRNIWTPIGWKDHFFRFNVIYNGTVMVRPVPGKWKTDALPWEKDGLQLDFSMSDTGQLPAPRKEIYFLHKEPDRGLGKQGWRENPTPVLWTELHGVQTAGTPEDGSVPPPEGAGIIVRQDIFAHVPGGKEIETGIEPLFAWIRLSVNKVNDPANRTPIHVFVHFSAPHMDSFMSQDKNMRITPANAGYPRVLTAGSIEDTAKQPVLRVIESDKRVRMMALPSDDAKYTFQEALAPAAGTYYLRVTLPARVGAHADLLLPFIPASRADADKEWAMGFEGALKESDGYWKKVPEKAARVETPERQVNEAIARTLKFAELITERNPRTGHYSFLTGSGHYDRLWPTPTSMVGHMLLDLFGYQSVVEKHIELFRKEQGTVKPPGPAYELHPGYFSAPKSLTSIDWLPDHGAILHEIAEHALLTDDKQFIEKWLDPMIKGCEFIVYARSLTNHSGVPGLMAPAVDTDRGVPNQSVWAIAWNYKGLYTAARLLQRLNHPRATEFAGEARRFKEDFIREFRKQTKTMPQWTDNEGKSHPVIPAGFTEGAVKAKDAFYLDTGSMVLVWAGLMDADDELMRTSTAFFREGPNTKTYNLAGSHVQPPVLVREISSCEPCYSWNIYHSLQLGDRRRYLEGMYSLLTGALSSQTYVSCETRHGIHGNIFASVLFTDIVRRAVIDDQLHENELHLLHFCPLAWISREKETRFENMPTEFGPISLHWRLSEDGQTLRVKYEPKFRQPPAKVRMYVPPANGLKTIEVNGKKVAAEKDGTIHLQ